MTKTDEILKWLEDWISGGKKVKDLGDERWEDIGLTLNICLSEEHKLLFLLEQKVAEEKVKLIDTMDISVASAEVRVEANDIYRQMKEQKYKVGRIEEFIRLVKLRARRDI